MQRPGFGIVTGVVVILAALAFLSRALLGTIPKGPENRLAIEQSDYLQQGAHQAIDWYPLTETPFVEARRKDKPVMFVVGNACSSTGRFLDNVVFPAPELRGYIAQNFICVRVDSLDYPEFANAYLPITRGAANDSGRAGIPTDLQVWFLTPAGELFGYTAQTSVLIPFDQSSFLQRLVAAVDQFDRIRKRLSEAGQEQRADIAKVRSEAPGMTPDFAAFGDLLASATGRSGGFPLNGFQRLWPNAWRYQLLCGRYEEYAQSISRAVHSPLVDVLDGGFFSRSASLDWHGISYDKLAAENAGMLRTLTLGGLLMRDPDQMWLARRTFDSLAGEFVQAGYIAAGRIGDEDSGGRSARSSFSPRRMRELMGDNADREWLHQNFGLRVETNPQMSPILRSIALAREQPPVFDRYVAALLKSAPAPKFTGLGQLDSGGFAVARLLESARLMGDRDRMSRAETLFLQLDGFRTVDDVRHSTSPTARLHGYLGDYLAFADASFQYFLVTGNDLALQNGAAVLKRGLFLYAGKTQGEYDLSPPPDTKLAPQDTDSPEIVDNSHESCTAMVIRLCSAYARAGIAPELKQVADDTFARFSSIASQLGPFAAGYYCAALDVPDSVFACVAGAGAVEKASAIAAEAPTRLVIPAVGGLAKRLGKPGIYVIADASVQGPLSKAAALSLLKRPRL